MAEIKEYYLDDKIFFGKHKGKTINQIWSTDPGWIKWATGNNIMKVVMENRPVVEDRPYYLDLDKEWWPVECPF